MEENSRTFLEKLRSNKNCFKMNKVSFLDLSELGPDQDCPEKELMLKFLKFDASCDVTTLSDGKTFVKIVDKRQSASNALFTQQVFE